ncbi:hypothetical protein BH20VER1_BH20VER1_10740 [soil metagenome]
MLHFRTFLFCAALLLLSGSLAPASEAIRSVQEELRKRNMYYGDIDGRETPGFLEALKRYQERKGFPATGVADGNTLRSMGLTAPPEEAALLSVPVLRSDRGPAPGAVRPLDGSAALAQSPLRDTTPPTLLEAQGFIRSYLEACASPEVADELAFYGDRVVYFHHGLVDREYIRSDLYYNTGAWSFDIEVNQEHSTN